MMTHSNINPADADMTLVKTDDRLWALYYRGELWGKYGTFQEAMTVYTSLCMEE